MTCTYFLSLIQQWKLLAQNFVLCHMFPISKVSCIMWNKMTNLVMCTFLCDCEIVSFAEVHLLTKLYYFWTWWNTYVYLQPICISCSNQNWRGSFRSLWPVVMECTHHVLSLSLIPSNIYPTIFQILPSRTQYKYYKNKRSLQLAMHICKCNELKNIFK